MSLLSMEFFIAMCGGHMIGRTVRAVALVSVGMLAPVLPAMISAPAYAVVGAAEQAVLRVVVSAEAQGTPAAQVAFIMNSNMSSTAKSLAIQWLVEGAATDAQVTALANAVVAAAAAAARVGQTGVVAMLGTGLGQAVKALAGDGRSSAAGAVREIVVAATSSGGAIAGRIALLFAVSFNNATQGVPRSDVNTGGEQEQEDPGETDNPRGPSAS